MSSTWAVQGDHGAACRILNTDSSDDLVVAMLGAPTLQGVIQRGLGCGDDQVLTRTDSNNIDAIFTDDSLMPLIEFFIKYIDRTSTMCNII